MIPEVGLDKPKAFCAVLGRAVGFNSQLLREAIKVRFLGLMIDTKLSRLVKVAAEVLVRQASLFFPVLG